MLELFTIFQDGMILQRDKPVSVWGWAQSGTRVSVSFLDAHAETKANDQGEWKVTLPATAFGGSYELSVSNGQEKITISDILVGDVYLASGQSNMELPLSRTLDCLKDDIEKINNPMIREFRVPITYAFDSPKNRLIGGSWKEATGEEIPNLSAVGYFFAASLYEQHGVPIGIVNTGVGGSPIEAWLSENSIRAIGSYEDTLALCKDDTRVQDIITTDLKRSDNWYGRLDTEDRGISDPANNWNSKTYDDTQWSTADIPVYFRTIPALKNLQGCVWFRKSVIVPEGAKLTGAILFLGAIIDADEVFINGIPVGKTEYMYPPRRYPIPEGILREGTNLIAIRLVINRNSGGFVIGKKYELTGMEWKVDLSGKWKYSIGAVLPELPQMTFFQYKPCGLFNAMFSPLLPYRFRGILWYQGESNERNPDAYESRLNMLITEWRAAIGEEVPFLYVQLPNFEDPTEQTPENSWAILREAQREILVLPHTAMAVAIDSGEANDVHPQNKKTVGQRLALCARALVYGENIEYSGPCCTRAHIDENGLHVILEFSHMEGGATLRNLPSAYFELREEEGTYRSAVASIRGNTISLDCVALSKPVAVRYAWRNNPENPDLYNNTGLPASPFEILISR